MASEQHLIEAAKRLSESGLWEIQENYFSSKGVTAWQNEVPFFISSNAFISARYAQMVAQLIQDLIDKKSTQGPLYIIEIGAGHGKFSFYFLKTLQTLLQNLNLPDFDYRYIISDVAEKNVDFCQKNEVFQPYIESNHLDFAVYDVRNQEDFELRLAQTQFSICQPDWPVVYICNYVFDLLPHDAFQFDNDDISEMVVELCSRYQVFDVKQPKRIRDLILKPSFHSVSLEGYYGNKLHSELLQYYRQYFEGQSSGFFMFPIGAMRFADTIKKFSEQSVLLCGDKGIALQENLPMMTSDNFYTFDGCFAFNMNFHALGAYLSGQKGDYLPSQHQNFFNVSLYTQGITFDDLPQLRTYFLEDMESMGADEFCFLNEELAYNGYRYSLKSCLSMLRLSHYDPGTYYHVHDKFMNQFETMNESLVKDVTKALMQVEANLFHDKSFHDVFSLIGDFYLKANQIKKAEELYQLALKHSKKPFEVYRRLGKLYEKRGNGNRAIEYYKKAVALNSKDKFSKYRIQILEGSPIGVLIPLAKALFVMGVCAGLMYLVLYQ